MAIEAKRLTNSDYLCMAGGVALNCVANGKLLDMGVFREIFVQPAAGDAGGSLGAAQASYYIHFQQPRTADGKNDTMQGAYLGPEFTDKEVELMNRKHKAVASLMPVDELAKKVAALIAEGNVIGWVQGRMEFGPRALGNRSIIGDPRNAEMQKKMNLKIKFRESFRPFAPALMAEECQKYFKGVTHSPYMLVVQPINEEHRKPVQSNYWNLPLKERLYADRSSLPAITHVDMSCRIQTVHRDTNPRFWSLINEFKKLSGHGMVINTSFNVRSEPIVCSPEDAYRCFMRTEMDYLVIGNHLYDKKTQPAWPGKDEDWMKEFELD
jgi:carbamoyltransferase